MPYKSQKQRAFFNANKAKLQAQGVDVEEWNDASKGLKLPKAAPKTAPRMPGRTHPKAGPHHPTLRGGGGKRA